MLVNKIRVVLYVACAWHAWHLRGYNLLFKDSGDMMSAWKYFHQKQYVKKIPHMYKFVSVLYSLPAHTCDVERGFSTRRLLKDRLRNKIQV